MTKEELKARLQGERYRKPSFWDKNFPKAFWGLGLLLLALACFTAIHNYNFMQKATKTIGEVIRLDGGNYRQGYAPVVQYIDATGKARLFYSTEFSRPPRFEIGQKVSIYYNKKDPQDASMGFSWLFIFVLLGIGIVFTFFGIIFQKFFSS